jgi:hypothetical protein
MPGGATATENQAPPTARDLNGHPQIPQGGLFNLPGITYWSYQLENNDQTTLTLSSSTQTVFQFPANLTNTDVLYREIIDVNLVVTQALNAGTVFAASAYNPYNYVGPVQLSMQNQFNTIDVPSGIDLKIFEQIRPEFNTLSDDYFETNPNVGLSSVPQLNQSTFSALPAFTQAGTSIKFSLDLPMGIWFDRYFDMDPDGQLRDMTPVRTFVTPQLMSGSNRIVTPRMFFNPILASNNDQGPWVVNAAGPTASGTVTLGWQRKIIYQPRAHTDTPMLWGWQYSRETKQYSVAGRSTADLLLPTTGQLLMVYYRFFDPSAATGGLPIPTSQLKNIWLQYGSGLFKYQDTALRAQRRYQRQHNNYFPPAEGIIVHDLVVDEQGYTSNQNALNTLDTSSCKIHFDFTVTLSATAYVYIGVEALRFVVQQ